jgi:hypothetical protein
LLSLRLGECLMRVVVVYFDAHCSENACEFFRLAEFFYTLFCQKDNRELVYFCTLYGGILSFELVELVGVALSSGFACDDCIVHGISF